MKIDRILYGGRIYTMDDAQPIVSALAISGERIAAVGNDDAILALASGGTQLEFLRGRAVFPGFVDCHVHWRWTAESMRDVDCFDVPSKEEALTRIRRRAAETPAGEWIMGYGWSQDVWDDKHFPTAADLDGVAPDHPVFLRARSGHAAWVNTKALALCGVTADTRVQEDSEIMHGSDGQPNGILLEWGAMELVSDLIPEPSPERLADLMMPAQQVALSLGMTGIHDFDDQEVLGALQVMRARGDLGLRAVKNINNEFLDSALEMGLRWGFGDDWLRLGGLKLFIDGAIGPHTASMMEAYDGEPDNFGIIVIEKEVAYDLIHRASMNGFPSVVHAIGDRAVRDILDVYQRVRADEAAAGIPRNTRRHRIEHVQLIHPDDVGRLASLDLIASMQPIHATSDYPIADQFWGARTPYSYNPRLQLDRGVRVIFGSDSPCDRLGVMIGIHAAVTRRRADGSPGDEGWNPAARTTIDEAIRAYTLNPAYTAGLEDRLGRLSSGYLADLVVLDQDPYTFESDPMALLDISVIGTMVGGAWGFGDFAERV